MQWAGFTKSQKHGSRAPCGWSLQLVAMRKEHSFCSTVQTRKMSLQELSMKKSLFSPNAQMFVYPSCGFMIKVWDWFGDASSLSLSSFNHVAEIFHLFFLLAF